MKKILIFTILNFLFYFIFYTFGEFEKPIINEFVTPLFASIPVSFIVFSFFVGIFDVLIKKETVEVNESINKKDKKPHLKIVK